MRHILIAILVITLAITPALAQTDASPAIEVSPDTVNAGDTIEVTGTGFTPGLMVSAFLGVPETGMRGEPFTSAQVMDDSTFALSFTMPTAWPSGAPITERDLLVVIASDFQPIASAPFRYNVSLAALGWQERYNPTFDFSVLVPPDWTFGESTEGFDFTMSGMETVAPVVIMTVKAVPQDVNDEVMSLEEYIQASPEQGIKLEGVAEVAIDRLTPIMTVSGEEGFVAEWTAENEAGEIVATGKSAYFEISQLHDDTFYRTIQITSSDPSGLIFFDAVVGSFTRGHQPIDACESAGDGVAETERLIQTLCINGATVIHEGVMPQIANPILHAPGVLLKVNGATVQVYEYPDEAAAQEAIAPIAPDGSGIGPALIDWMESPHFFSTGRIVVLYIGDDPDVYAALEAALGPQVAGTVISESSTEPTRISWEEARELILSGEVEFIFQAHSLEVQINTRDGRRFVTTEPRIDEVFAVVGECGDTCLNIGLATE